jgi:hypothetical protein
MEFTIRPASVADVDEICRICNQVWDGIWAGDRQMFIDRITTFSEAGIVVGEIDGQIEGYISAQIADEETIFRPTWDEATDFGHLVKTHDPEGSWFHGVGLAVTLKGSRTGLTGMLIAFMIGSIVERGKIGARFITRMPAYYRYQGVMTPEDYAVATHNGKPLDPELRIMAEYGLHVTNPPLIFRNYVAGGGDPHSCGCSVLVELLNPERSNNSTG